MQLFSQTTIFCKINYLRVNHGDEADIVLAASVCVSVCLCLRKRLNTLLSLLIRN